MSATGLDVFDKTLHTTHVWLDELMAEIGPDRHVAWHVLGAVLRAIRDRIPLELAVHLGSQLPLLVRGAYYDRWHAPGRMDEKPRSLEAFLEPIQQQCAQIRPVNVRQATRAVFQILSRHVSQGQVEKVRNALPGHVRALWPDEPDMLERPERRQRPSTEYGVADAMGSWRLGMKRSRLSGINVGVRALVATGLAAAALAAFRSSTRRPSLAWSRGGKRMEDRSPSGGHIQDRAGRNRRRDEGLRYESRRLSWQERDNARRDSDQRRGHSMTGWDHGSSDIERDYRGGGYGSAYIPGSYDPDNDYRGDTGGTRSGLGESLVSGRGYGGSRFGEHRGHGPKSYTRSDDRIREDVCDRLTDDPRLDASEIDVSVSNGEVTLSGAVGDRMAKRRAEEIAERVGGVRHVQNNLRMSQGGADAGPGAALEAIGSADGVRDMAGITGSTGMRDRASASGP